VLGSEDKSMRSNTNRESYWN